MFEAGAVRKERKLARIAVVLGVILIFSSIGMTLTAASPNDTPPGQDQCEEGHGANDKECVPDPSDGHGQECEEHGNGGINENHCGSDTTTGGTTGDTTTGGSTGDTTTGGSTGDTTTGGSTGDTTTGGSTGDTTTGGSTGDTTTGGSTGDTTTGGTSTGGAENGTTTGAPVVESDDTEVLGKTVTRKALATTGSTTTILAVFGVGLLMVGSFLRFGRFGTRVAMATGADELIARSLALIERQARTGSRYWNSF